MRLLIVAAVIAGVGACSPAPAPVPEGYVFPTWHVGTSGAAALLEGTLTNDQGCLFLQPQLGDRYLVVWPDTYQLVLACRRLKPSRWRSCSTRIMRRS